MTSTAPAHFLSGKHIVVSGAGIAGLAFAIALRKQWAALHSTLPAPTLTLLERDTPASAARREGYSLSIRGDPPGGVAALAKLGLLERVLAVSINESDASRGGGFCMWDGALRPIFKVIPKPVDGLPVGAMRIVRGRLREVLVAAAEEVDGAENEATCEIRWGVVATGVERRTTDGRLDVMLDDGTSQVADLVVAADGASSKLRRQLRPDDKLEYRKICVLGGTGKFEGAPPAPIDRHWGMVLAGKGAGLFLSPVDDHSALWSLSYRTDEEKPSKNQPMSQEEADELLAEARVLAAEYDQIPMLADLLNRTDPTTLMRFNAKDKPPFYHPAADGFDDVVFLGDANHAVSPFAGNGANMALNDGWDFARLLCESSSLKGAVTAYDKIVVPRSRKVWKQSHFNIAVGHSKGIMVWVYSLLFRIVMFFMVRRHITIASNETAHQ